MKQSKQSILVLYSGIGHGHRKLAENITHHLSDGYDVDLMNLFVIQGKSTLVSGGSKLFLWMLDHASWMWNFLYTNKVFTALSLPLRRPFASTKSKQVLQVLQGKHYDAVISCHAMTSAILSSLKVQKKFDGKLLVAFSDYHLHRYWMFDNVDRYLVNIPEQEKEMLSLGVPKEKISIVGVTLKQVLQENDSEKLFDVKRKLGIPENKKVILVAGGTSGYGIDLETANELAVSATPEPAELVVVCGKNIKLHDDLMLHASEHPNMKVFGYVDNMPELYSVADLLISKPGGLSVAECLQRNLPVLVTSYMPGQEKLNLDYLVGNRLVMVTKGEARAELQWHSFSSTLLENKARALIVQDDGVLLREAVRKTLG